MSTCLKGVSMPTAPAAVGSCMESCLMSADRVQPLDASRKSYLTHCCVPGHLEKPPSTSISPAPAPKALHNCKPQSISPEPVQAGFSAGTPILKEVFPMAVAPEQDPACNPVNGILNWEPPAAMPAGTAYSKSASGLSATKARSLIRSQPSFGRADDIAMQASNMMEFEKQMEIDAKLTRLKAKFKLHDINKDGLVSIQEFKKQLYMQGKHIPSDDALKKMVRNLKDLALKRVSRGDDTAGMSKVYNPEAEYAHEDAISFALFAALMLSESLGEDVDSTTMAQLDELRACFIEDDHAALVAQALHVSKSNLDEEQGTKHKTSLQLCVARWLDPLMAGVIIVNAVTIGLSTNSDLRAWEILEYIFCSAYLLEFIIKNKVFGCLEYWFGEAWAWNLFDFACLIMGIFDATVRIMESSSDIDTGINLSELNVVRVTRLARLTRLVRLVKFFKELSLMVSGLFNGLRTMAWSVLLLFVLIYVIGVGCTQLLGAGEEDIPHRDELFSTVDKSMFTVFRCLTDGCTNVDGTPLNQRLMEEYGLLFMLVYCLLVVLITFGLFNLFMAIFVESTMQTAKFNDQKVAAARRQEFMRVGRKLKTVVAKFTRALLDEDQQKRSIGTPALLGQENQLHAQKLRKWCAAKFGFTWLVADQEREDDARELLLSLGEVQDIGEVEVSRSLFEQVLTEPGIQRLLDELELADTDRLDLFDVLDADGSGSLTIEEIVSGMLKVRGEARKGDVVAIRLAIRSLQHAIKQISFSVVHTREDCTKRLGLLSEDMRALHASQQMLADRLGNLEQNMMSIQQGMGAIITALRTPQSTSYTPGTLREASMQQA